MSNRIAPITPAQFFAEWRRVCSERTPTLLRLWMQLTQYTNEILNQKGGDVLECIARNLEMHVHAGYYSIDAIFYRDEDKVHCAPTHECWVQNIRIAFEHEHDFASGLFKEVSHLLVTRAELRVLVVYPGSDSSLKSMLAETTRIISEAGLQGASPAFLCIAGTRINNKTDILWEAYLHQGDAFESLN